MGKIGRVDKKPYVIDPNTEINGIVYMRDASLVSPRTAEFRCHCGIEFIARVNNWKSGMTKSCGCARTKHAYSGAPWYSSYMNMLHRVKSHPRYVDVSVCDAWLDIKQFAADKADTHFPEAHLSRYNDEGDYTNANTRWLTPSDSSKERHGALVS